MKAGRTHLIAIVFITVLSSTISSNIMAATPIQGWYGTGFGGLAWLSDNINFVSNDGLLRSNASYDLGYDLGGAIGFKSGPIRYEGEFTYINANPNHFDLNGVRVSDFNGESTAWVGMANIYYDFDNYCVNQVVPYVGFGLGYTHVIVELNSQLPRVNNLETNGNKFAVQGTAGISWNFSNNGAVTVGYRYFTTADSDTDFGKRFQANLGNVGILYRFDQPYK